MSIASEITRLQNAKAAIKAAIEAKGVTVDDDATLDAFASLIGQIATSDDTVLKALIDRSITSIEIPSGIASIGNGAFLNTALTTITIPNGITSIGLNAFQGCTNLASVILPSDISTIGEGAFQNAYITEITIPSSITSIGLRAFDANRYLESVTVLAAIPPTLGANVFRNNKSGRKIYVPAESVNAYKAATNWSEYANDIEAIPTNS